jgi:4-alpha-methyl-delta7-sterol-4alpha-methyl oxidase
MDAFVQWMKGAYQDPAFLILAVGLWVMNHGTYFLFAMGMTVLNMKQPKWAEFYRVQPRQVDNRHLIWPTIRLSFLNGALLIIGTVVLWPVMYAAGVHYTPEWPAWYTIVWQVLFAMYVDDFVYYFIHRVLHRPWFFKRVHYLHHSVKTPWAMIGHYQHPVEFMLTGITVLMGQTILGAHVVSIFAWILVRQYTGAIGHLGYELKVDPLKLLPGYRGVVFHDYHHSHCDGNYSGGLGWVDGLFGTWSTGYVEGQKAMDAKLRAARAAKKIQPDAPPPAAG